MARATIMKDAQIGDTSVPARINDTGEEVILHFAMTTEFSSQHAGGLVRENDEVEVNIEDPLYAWGHTGD